jgi:uncharacterized membrane protein YagU involved in acid resistance
MTQGDRRCVFLDIACGLAAGAAATFVMGKVSTFAYSLEDETTRQYEENLRHQEYPPEVLAGKLAKAVEGVELDRETRQKRGTAIHWGYGVFWGGMFGALRDRVPLVGTACGVGFGLGLWLIGDEVLMPAMGLSPPSTQFPWRNHARAAANHLAYGVTLGVTHTLLRKIAS